MRHEFHVVATDIELLELAQQGNRHKFAELCARYWQGAVNVAAVICGDCRDPGTVVRVAFHHAWSMRLAYSERDGSARAWLIGIVRDHAVTVRAGDELWGLVEFSFIEIERYLAMNEEFSRNDIDAEAIDSIAILLKNSPDEQREVIALAFFGQLSPDEIAQQLGLTEGAVLGRMRLGTDDLRALLIVR